MIRKLSYDLFDPYFINLASCIENADYKDTASSLILELQIGYGINQNVGKTGCRWWKS